MKTLCRNLWWICLAGLLLGAPHWLAAQQFAIPDNLASTQVSTSPSEASVAYTNNADSDCAVLLQAALVDGSGIQHALTAFDADDSVVPQNQHRRSVVEAATVDLGQPSVAFARLYPSRETRELNRVLLPDGRAPPAI